MAKGRNDFLKVFVDYKYKSSIPRSIWDNIRKREKSPLNYFLKCCGELPVSNGLEHSQRVLTNCFEIIRNSKLETICKSTDLIVLFYASLLHDIDKINKPRINREIKSVLKKTCTLFREAETGHGIRSAHYIEEKYKSKKIVFYGLRKADINRLFNIICFHSTGSIHSCFLNNPVQLKREEILLYLIFWVADIADGAFYRVEPDLTVKRSLLSNKIKARGKVTKVKIKDNLIIWHVDGITKNLTTAARMENENLSSHRLLLMAFGLPYRLTIVANFEKVEKDDYLEFSDLISDGLCADVKNRNVALLLSEKTLPDLYEMIVDAFCSVSVSKKLSPSPQNYFGPIILEVRNIDTESDELETKTKIRSETKKTISLIKGYTEQWLKMKQGEEKAFYYGYTHGQRIWRYLYPEKKEDYDDLKDIQKWTGKIDQFENIVKLLKAQKSEARRAYAVIAHPIIDNPMSRVGKKEAMAPALICIQFTIEKGNRLSAFALLRSQELSTWFIVNYFEVKKLITELLNRLKNSITNIKAGRIVMMTALGYFHPNTVLLDRPRICKKGVLDWEDYGEHIEDIDKKKEFIDLLDDFANDYIKIETEWCEHFKRYLPKKYIKDFTKFKKNLDSLARKVKTKGYSPTTESIRSEKKDIVDEFKDKIL